MSDLSPQLPANEARANFYKILEDVDKYGSRFTITLRGRDKAVIMSADEFDSWKETFEVMADKKLVKSIKRGLKSKKSYTEDEVDQMLGWNKSK